MPPVPYDTNAGLFRIGLKPLDLADWIDVDDKLDAYLFEKERLGARYPGRIFAAETGTEDAQAEVLSLLVEHLPERFPSIYRRQGDVIEIVPAGRRVPLNQPDVPPLRIAASLIQEDLVLMQHGDPGWRLAAASLSFPSSWRLANKFGRPLDQVHAPVPGFGPDTRNAGMIARIFDNLKVELPVLRWNWSLYGDEALHHPEPENPKGHRFGSDGENVFLRAERQTLRKLPLSGDILFTIRIYSEPLEILAEQANGAEIAASLIRQLEGLDADQLAYKGLAEVRDRLVERLARLA